MLMIDGAATIVNVAPGESVTVPPNRSGGWNGRGRQLTVVQRAALPMLATSPRGFALSTVMARGFSFEMLQGLVRAGLATSHRDAIGAEKSRVSHLRITAAGRKAVAE